MSQNRGPKPQVFVKIKGQKAYFPEDKDPR